MKYFVLALLLLMSGGLFAQHAPAATFNKVEASALNTDFEAKNPGFDFHGKKIAIVSGSTGKNIISKEAYLSQRLKMNGAAVQQLVILNEAEKKASGGYDALIAYYVKIFPSSSRRYVIKQLQKAHLQQSARPNK